MASGTRSTHHSSREGEGSPTFATKRDPQWLVILFYLSRVQWVYMAQEQRRHSTAPGCERCWRPWRPRPPSPPASLGDHPAPPGPVSTSTHGQRKERTHTAKGRRGHTHTQTQQTRERKKTTKRVGLLYKHTLQKIPVRGIYGRPASKNVCAFSGWPRMVCVRSPSAIVHTLQQNTNGEGKKNVVKVPRGDRFQPSFSVFANSTKPSAGKTHQRVWPAQAGRVSTDVHQNQNQNQNQHERRCGYK